MLRFAKVGSSKARGHQLLHVAAISLESPKAYPLPCHSKSLEPTRATCVDSNTEVKGVGLFKRDFQDVVELPSMTLQLRRFLQVFNKRMSAHCHRLHEQTTWALQYAV